MNMKVGLEITRRKRRVVAPLNLGWNLPPRALNALFQYRNNKTIEKARSKKFAVEMNITPTARGIATLLNAKCPLPLIT